MSMTMVYQLGGTKKIWNLPCKFKVVNGSAELAEALASGWHLHPYDAADAAAQAAADKAAQDEKDKIDQAQKEADEADEAEAQRLNDEIARLAADKDAQPQVVDGSAPGVTEQPEQPAQDEPKGGEQGAQDEPKGDEPKSDADAGGGSTSAQDEAEKQPVKATRKTSTAKK